MSEWQIQRLGLREYQPTLQAMQDYTATRGSNDPDQLWLLQHPPVFTQGLNGKPEHILQKTTIPVVAIDRGGQVTYHGPGQLVMYCLIDLKRNKLGVRQVVSALENAVISLLARYGIESRARADAPGVYVGEAKIAALGLRVKKGCCYHGLSLNIDMDLSPFQQINPCGYKDLAVTQLADLGVRRPIAEIETDLVTEFSKQLGFSVTDEPPAATNPVE